MLCVNCSLNSTENLQIFTLAHREQKLIFSTDHPSVDFKYKTRKHIANSTSIEKAYKLFELCYLHTIPDARGSE